MKQQSLVKKISLLLPLIIILIVVFVSGTIKDQKEQQIIAQKAEQLNKEIKAKQLEESIRNNLPDISCWGDGLTTGSDSDGPSYPEVLSQLTHLTVHNMGVNREDSATIATRQGGRQIIVNEITIPSTTTPVKIGTSNTLYNDANELVRPMLKGEMGINPVTLYGIEGTLSVDKNSPTNYYFTRNTEGESVDILEPTPLLTRASTEHKDDITIIFIGQNGGYDSINELINQQTAMIEHLEHDRYLVLGLTTGTKSERQELESQLLDTFQDKFINLREYLSTSGLEDANIEPTKADLEAMKLGKVPSSLLINNSIVGNRIFHELIAKKIYDKIIELEYLDAQQQRYLQLN